LRGRETPPDRRPIVIATKKSQAKATTITVNNTDIEVRFVPGVEGPPTPFNDGAWKVAELNGVGIAWVRCNGKAYADPSLKSYTFECSDWSGNTVEASTRIEAFADWLKYSEKKTC
jgi:hypothetical protein